MKINPLHPGRNILRYFESLAEQEHEPMATVATHKSWEFTQETDKFRKKRHVGPLNQEETEFLYRFAGDWCRNKFATYDNDGGMCTSAQVIGCGTRLQKSHADLHACSAEQLRLYGEPTFCRNDHFRPGLLLMPLFDYEYFPNPKTPTLPPEAGKMVTHTYPSYGQFKRHQGKMDKGLRLELHPPYGLWLDGCKVHAGGVHRTAVPPAPSSRLTSLWNKKDAKGLSRNEKAELRRLEAIHKEEKAAWLDSPDCQLRLHFHFDRKDMPRPIGITQIIDDAFSRGAAESLKLEAVSKLGLVAQTKARSGINVDYWKKIQDDREARRRNVSEQPSPGAGTEVANISQEEGE